MFRITKHLARASIRWFSSATDRLIEESTKAGVNPELIERVKKIQQNEPYFDRLLYIDTDYLAHIPYIFKPIEPFVEAIKDIMLSANSVLGLPWWAVIMGSCLAIRLAILPLMFVQIQKVNKLAPLAPVFVHLKNTYKISNLPKRKKLWLFMKSVFQIVHSQNLKFNRLFIYNIVNYTFIITMVYSIRRLLSVPAVASTSFLHIPALSGIDPFFILPITTIALYYYNFQRFITPENKHTFLSRIRTFCQFLLILWLPFLCYWPSGIVLYMFTNALLSVIQTSLFVMPTFMKRVSPKFLAYNFLMGMVEYDKAKSQSVVQTIRTGEDSLKERAIEQEALLKQTQNMVDNLNKQLKEPEDQEQEPQKDSWGKEHKK